MKLIYFCVLQTYIVYMGDLPKSDSSVASVHTNMLQKVIGWLVVSHFVMTHLSLQKSVLLYTPYFGTILIITFLYFAQPGIHIFTS